MFKDAQGHPARNRCGKDSNPVCPTLGLCPSIFSFLAYCVLVAQLNDPRLLVLQGPTVSTCKHSSAQLHGPRVVGIFRKGVFCTQLKLLVSSKV